MGQRLRSSRAASAKPRNRPQRRAQAGTAATARILPGGGALTPSLMRKLQASAGNAAVAQLAVQRCGPGGCGGKCCGGGGGGGGDCPGARGGGGGPRGGR